MSKEPQSFYKVEDGVAIITISYPPMNALHPTRTYRASKGGRWVPIFLPAGHSNHRPPSPR